MKRVRGRRRKFLKAISEEKYEKWACWDKRMSWLVLQERPRQRKERAELTGFLQRQGWVKGGDIGVLHKGKVHRQ